MEMGGEIFKNLQTPTIRCQRLYAISVVFKRGSAEH